MLCFEPYSKPHLLPHSGFLCCITATVNIQCDQQKIVDKIQSPCNLTIISKRDGPSAHITPGVFRVLFGLGLIHEFNSQKNCRQLKMGKKIKTLLKHYSYTMVPDKPK